MIRIEMLPVSKLFLAAKRDRFSPLDDRYDDESVVIILQRYHPGLHQLIINLRARSIRETIKIEGSDRDDRI